MTTTGGAPGGDYLSRAEVIASIRALPDAEKTALTKIAMGYARRTTYGYEDLMQESMLRVLDGRRPWPRALPAVPFLAGIIRSITWDWKIVPVDESARSHDFQSEERNTLAMIDSIKILALFSDDNIAQVIVGGMLEGARGEDLQKISGLSKTDYESKRTKIRRRIEKQFAPVWKP